MIRLRNILPIALAVMVGAAVMGVPTEARADFKLYLQEDGGAIVQVATNPSFTPVSFSGTFGDFDVQIFGSSSNNGTTLSRLTTSTTSVVNNSGATHTLTLYASEQDYTLPSTTKLGVESG